MRKLIFILIFTAISVGCFNNVEERLLIGNYHFSTYKSDIIFFYKDHTYKHRYINTKGKVFEDKGKWQYAGNQITFDDFNFFNDLGPSGGPGLWIARIIENNGKIHLIYSSDDDTYFEKE